MFPIIPPGSLVVIDDTKRRIVNSGWNSEFERPIYFLEHREGLRVRVVRTARRKCDRAAASRISLRSKVLPLSG